MAKFTHRLLLGLLNRLGLSVRRFSQVAYGRKFVIPVIGGRQVYVHESWMVETIARLFAVKAGAFIDVGVNLGQTMLKVAAADPQRKYLRFDPNPACVNYALELIRVNGFDYQVIPAGLGRKTDVFSLQLYNDDATDPSASLVEDSRKLCCGFTGGWHFARRSAERHFPGRDRHREN